MPKLCLFDASGYLHRAFHAIPPLTTSKGEPVNAIYGFCRMVSKVLKEERPTHVAVCFDTPVPTFRHVSFEAYKATRTETDNSLIVQLPVAEDVVAAWGLAGVKKDGFEADDVIATLARQGGDAGLDVLILSGDKDILQLVNDRVRVRDEMKKVEYDAARVVERYGVSPERVVDLLALMGDKVDNVDGIPGVGEKTASKLVAENGSIDEMLRVLADGHSPLAKKISANADLLRRNRELVRLRTDVPLDLSLDDLKPRPADSSALSTLLTRLEFTSPLYGAEAAVAEPVLATNTERQVRVVLTDADLSALVSAIKDSDFVAYDLETDGLNSHGCAIVGVSIAVTPKEAWYVPVGHRYIGAPTQLSWERVRAAIKPILENPDTTKRGQNLKFDNTVLKRHGIEPAGPAFDTMVAAYCLDPGRMGFGLKDLAGDFLGERMTRISELIGKGRAETFVEVPIETAAPYAGADSEVVVRLAPLLDEKLRSEEGLWSLFSELEMPLVRIIEAMEEAGIRIDEPYLRDVGRRFNTERAALEKEIFALAGEPFVLNSPKQLARILFEKLKLPTARRTKTGFSTDEDVLRKLAAEHPIAEKIIATRELSKLVSTYVDALLELRNPETDRVHTTFQQTGTITGRLSSSNPNLQNIPIRSEKGREIRRAFVARPGCRLLSADYSQIDLRVLAHISDDPVLIKTFHDGGDVHRATAAEMFHVKLDEVTAEMRRSAKTINFGIVYGQQAFALSQSLGISMETARDFIAKYFERYAGVRAWIETSLDQARHTQTVRTLAGRRRRVPDITSPSATARGFSERVAINTPIQGSSADIIKFAMIRVFDAFEKKRFESKLLLQVHDELLFEAPDKEMAEVMTVVRREMENAFALRVPLVVDIKTGANWNDMTKQPATVAA